MNLEEALVALKAVETRLAEMERELANLRGEPCDKCGRLDGAVAGVDLTGGFEVILCRFCRNDWAIVADESGCWLEYRKAVASEEATRDFLKTSGATPDVWQEVVDRSVQAVVDAERKLFQLAKKWITGGAL